jgi:hypothetical protein
VIKVLLTNRGIDMFIGFFGFLVYIRQIDYFIEFFQLSHHLHKSQIFCCASTIEFSNSGHTISVFAVQVEFAMVKVNTFTPSHLP